MEQLIQWAVFIEKLGESAKAPAAPKKEGYDFVKWEGSIPLKAGESFDIRGEETFKAVWKKAPAAPAALEIKFDAKGGKFEDGKEIATVNGKLGESVKAPAAPKKEGYDFVKWEGSIPLEAGEAFDIRGEETFKAIWKKAAKPAGTKPENTNKKDEVKNNAPKTGDSTNILLMVMLVVASCGALGGVVAVRKNRQ